MKRTLTPPGEFELIARYFAPLAKGFPGAYGLLDDAAVIAALPGHELVAKTDAIVGDVHFLLGDPPDLIARKALRVNLSDLAGKGAVPRAYMLAIMLPSTVTEEWIAAFARGLAQDQNAVDRYLLPQPRVTLGPRLAGLASAALDVSDGLLADLGHLCEVSELAAVIEARRVPQSAAARAALATNVEGIATILTGGDDYEILFTAPPGVLDELTELSQTLDVPITAIGRMQSSSIRKNARITALGESGESLNFDRGGWTHF